jgi:hypothetical protein
MRQIGNALSRAAGHLASEFKGRVQQLPFTLIYRATIIVRLRRTAIKDRAHLSLDNSHSSITTGIDNPRLGCFTDLLLLQFDTIRLVIINDRNTIEAQICFAK